MNKELWDERYSQKDYIYGTEPNTFLKETLDGKIPGKILFPADGEGRNSVYASSIGWEAIAFDQSEEGKNKALKLAELKNTKIEYLVSSITDFKYAENSFDAIALIYLHFPSSVRTEYYRKLTSYLKPNGLIILESFSKKQINYNTGGPKDIDMLSSKEILENEFSFLTEKVIIELETELLEGEYHKGVCSVVRLIGTK